MKKNDKLLYFNEWVSLYQAKNGFVYADRKGTNSVAVLAFRKIKNEYEFLIRYQPLAAIDKETKLFPCCITGSIDKNLSYEDIALEELYEEGGIKTKDYKRIIKTTSFISSTQLSEITYVYLIDVTNLKQNKANGDGSYYEKISHVKWVKQKELSKILENQVLVSLFIAYLLFLSTLS